MVWHDEMKLMCWCVCPPVSPQHAVPSVPTFKPSMSVPDWLVAVQNYMKALQYPSELTETRWHVFDVCLPVAPPPPSPLGPPPVGRELGVRRGGEERSGGHSTLDCVVPNTPLPQIQPHRNPVLRDQEEPSALWVRQRQPWPLTSPSEGGTMKPKCPLQEAVKSQHNDKNHNFLQFNVFFLILMLRSQLQPWSLSRPLPFLFPVLLSWGRMKTTPFNLSFILSATVRRLTCVTASHRLC